MIIADNDVHAHWYRVIDNAYDFDIEYLGRRRKDQRKANI